MTKRAIAIKTLTEELSALILDGHPLKTAIQGINPNITPEQGIASLRQYQVNIQACLVTILENNPEQAEALMVELNLRWKVPPSE